METLKIKSRYNHSEPRAHSFATTGESMTQQQFKDECNINNILAKYKKTGLLTHTAKHEGHFGDFTSIEDYQTSLHKIMEAENSFNMLPSEIRNRFQNDPGQLIGYLSDEKNNEEAYTLGLKIRPKPPEPSIQDQMETALENNDKKRNKPK